MCLVGIQIYKIVILILFINLIHRYYSFNIKAKHFAQLNKLTIINLARLNRFRSIISNFFSLDFIIFR